MDDKVKVIGFSIEAKFMKMLDEQKVSKLWVILLILLLETFMYFIHNFNLKRQDQNFSYLFSVRCV